MYPKTDMLGGSVTVAESCPQGVRGTHGFSMAPGQLMPSGKAVQVDGGYRISGRWGYAASFNHGDVMHQSHHVFHETNGT